MARIGIKLADGSFYPILETEIRQKKRLILTAARDGQTSAQIDLLRYDKQTEQYVGYLVLEDLPAVGTTELELVVGLDGEGNVEARISDAAGARYQSLSVSLDSVTGSESFSLPEDDDEEPLGDIAGVNSLEDIGLPDFDDSIGDAIDDVVDSSAEGVGENPPGRDEADLDETELEDDAEPEVEPRPFSALILAAVLLIGLSVAAAGAFLIFRWLQTDPLPELRAAVLLPVALWPRRRHRREI